MDLLSVVVGIVVGATSLHFWKKAKEQDQPAAESDIKEPAKADVPVPAEPAKKTTRRRKSRTTE